MDRAPSFVSSSSAALVAPSLTPQHDTDWPRDGNRVHLEQELALLPYMPALFGSDLPPCGPIPQVAYENVVRRLRKMWLQRANTHPVDIPVLGICQWILEDYKAEEDESPSGSERHTGRRKPWRREEVFKYELCWAKYFVCEAEALERRSGMPEKELEKQEFVEKLYPELKELHIYLRETLTGKAVLEMWKVWQRKKRGYAQVRDAQGGVGEADQDNKKELRNGEASAQVDPNAEQEPPPMTEPPWNESFGSTRYIG